MANAVFVLCALTSLVCLGLLVRSYRLSGARLVFWCAVCFAGLALNNIVLVVNKLILPSVDMPWRGIPAAAGLLALVYGLASAEVRSLQLGWRRGLIRRRSRSAA